MSKHLLLTVSALVSRTIFHLFSYVFMKDEVAAYRNEIGEPVPTYSAAADIAAFPILVKTTHICSLKNLCL